MVHLRLLFANHARGADWSAATRRRFQNAAPMIHNRTENPPPKVSPISVRSLPRVPTALGPQRAPFAPAIPKRQQAAAFRNAVGYWLLSTLADHFETSTRLSHSAQALGPSRPLTYTSQKHPCAGAPAMPAGLGGRAALRGFLQFPRALRIVAAHLPGDVLLRRG